jgi:transposase-like protein
MGKPHPIELRECAVTFVEAGNAHRSTAKRLGVSVKFVYETD